MMSIMTNLIPCHTIWNMCGSMLCYWNSFRSSWCSCWKASFHSGWLHLKKCLVSSGSCVHDGHIALLDVLCTWGLIGRGSICVWTCVKMFGLVVWIVGLLGGRSTSAHCSIVHQFIWIPCISRHCILGVTQHHTVFSGSILWLFVIEIKRCGYKLESGWFCGGRLVLQW